MNLIETIKASDEGVKVNIKESIYIRFNQIENFQSLMKKQLDSFLHEPINSSTAEKIKNKINESAIPFINREDIISTIKDRKPKRKKAIGLIGPMGGGKDTMANTIQSKSEENFLKIAFADEVRSMVFKTINYTPQDDYQYKKFKEILFSHNVDPSDIGSDDFNPFSGRDMLINLGDGMRKEDENYWINRVDARIQKLDSDIPIIFTDVRYPNEVDYLYDNFSEVELIFCAYKGKDSNMHLFPEIQSEKMACFFYYYKNKKHEDNISYEEVEQYKNTLVG